jgi:DNA-directed RNA polymerase specialized sigma24 family protein
MSGDKRTEEAGSIRKLIRGGSAALAAKEYSPTLSSVTHAKDKRRSFASYGNLSSSVEEDVLERETASLLSELSQASDPRLKTLRNAIEDPQIQQAMALQLGLKDNKPKSRTQIAQEMKIPEANVDALIKRGVEILRGSKETPIRS